MTRKWYNMSSNMRATILICIVTLFLSVAGAWGVLKTDTISQGTNIRNISTRMEKILDVISEQQKQMNRFNVEISNNKERIDQIKATLCRIDGNITELNKNTVKLSKIVARLDERVKNIED